MAWAAWPATLPGEVMVPSAASGQAPAVKTRAPGAVTAA